MERLFGKCLQRARGKSSVNQLAQRLDLSYTFVREMELGNRLPSDEVLMDIAMKLGIDFREALLAVYCDRSADLAKVLLDLGIVSRGGQVRNLPVTRSSKRRRATA